MDCATGTDHKAKLVCMRNRMMWEVMCKQYISNFSPPIGQCLMSALCPNLNIGYMKTEFEPGLNLT